MAGVQSSDSHEKLLQLERTLQQPELGVHIRQAGLAGTRAWIAEDIAPDALARIAFVLDYRIPLISKYMVEMIKDTAGSLGMTSKREKVEDRLVLQLVYSGMCYRFGVFEDCFGLGPGPGPGNIFAL